MSENLVTVKTELTSHFADQVGSLLDSMFVRELSPREIEEATWRAVVSIGKTVLQRAFCLACKGASDQFVEDKGWTGQVRMRLDFDYVAKLNTTFGRLRFPWFSFRGPDGRTHTPSRSLFPHYSKMRTSDLLLEWECSLASDHPFRKAADALLFFSHGAADVEDTTIERHAVLIGNSVPVEMLYMEPCKLRSTLSERATRDAETGKPIIYASTDAHALKRYVDDSWTPAWKMVNGIRVWCVDKDTSKIIHVGGEFTWGDCHVVAQCFERLQRDGILPADGDYGDGLVAQIALLTDGLGWIADYVLPLFPTAECVLDPYHVIEQVADTAAKLFPGKKGRSKAKKLVEAARRAIGMRRKRSRPLKRKGRRVRRYRRHKAGLDGSGKRLLDEVVMPLVTKVTAGKERLGKLISYITRNLFRLAYGPLRQRGFQIGSGPMESIHRTGSQVRLKRAGCKWTKQAAQAILNLRMLAIAGRWNEFWKSPNYHQVLAATHADKH